jgi:hypothetical protein
MSSDWISMASKNLDAVRYTPETMTLEVRFHNGREYHYYDVPQAMYEALLAASSKGAFFNQSIRGSYRYARM